MTRNVMKDSYLVIPLQAKHIEFGILIVVLLRKFMMLNLMKPKVHKKDVEKQAHEDRQLVPYVG